MSPNLNQIKAVRMKSIIAIFVMIIDLLGASVVSASQSTHFLKDLGENQVSHQSSPLSSKSQALSQESILSASPCHSDKNTLSVEELNDKYIDASSVNDSKSDMPCCADDCAHCPAFLTLYQVPSIGFRLLAPIEAYELSSDVPIINGHPVSIYRPPT